MTISIKRLGRLLGSFGTDAAVRNSILSFCESVNQRTFVLGAKEELSEIEYRRALGVTFGSRTLRPLSASALPERLSWQTDDEYVQNRIGSASFTEQMFGFYAHVEEPIDEIESFFSESMFSLRVAEGLDHSYPNLEYMERHEHMASTKAAEFIDNVLNDLLYSLAKRKTDLQDPVAAFQAVVRWVPIAFTGEKVIILTH